MISISTFTRPDKLKVYEYENPYKTETKSVCPGYSVPYISRQHRHHNGSLNL